MRPIWIEGKAARTHPLTSPASEKVFAMLVAYMDASGTHAGSHNSTIAGYWGSVNEWRRFSVAWKAVLDSEGLQEFHAKEFWPRKPDGERYTPYVGWTNERHARFIDGLLKVIEATKITPFACGVSPAEWLTMEKHTLEVVSSTDVERYQREAIRLPLHRIMLRVTSYCLPHKTMHYVCDNDKAVTQQAMLTLFSSVKQGLRKENSSLYSNLGELTFADSVAALPLQAADLLAYEAHRYAKQAEGNENRPVRDEYRRALRRFRSKEDFWFFESRRMNHLKKLFEYSMEESIHENLAALRAREIQSGISNDPESEA